MTNSAELQSLVEDFAADLSGSLPDPLGWGVWLKYLLEELEKHAAETGQPVERYDWTLELLRKAIEERVSGHQ